MACAALRNSSGIGVALLMGCASLTLLSGCRDREPRPVLAASALAPATVVDSILPIEEEIRRFAGAAGPAPSSFTSEWRSVGELAESFVGALVARDTAFLADAMVTPSEFITFYFPYSVYMQAPYQLDPAIVWFQMINVSDRGLTRALSRFEGRDVTMTGHTCPEPSREGPNTIWASCRVRLRHGAGEEVEVRLFGPVLERDGSVKFLGYGNDL